MLLSDISSRLSEINVCMYVVVVVVIHCNRTCFETVAKGNLDIGYSMQPQMIKTEAILVAFSSYCTLCIDCM